MAPPGQWSGRNAHYLGNMQDVGGEYNDNHKATGQPFLDAVDTPLSVAIKKAEKPVKYWVSWPVVCSARTRLGPQTLNPIALATGVPVPCAVLLAGGWGPRQIRRDQVGRHPRWSQV